MKSLLKYLLPLAALFIAVSCKEGESIDSPNGENISLQRLLEAYNSGKIFDNASSKESSCEIRFTDGSTIIVPNSDFKIEDCTSSSPKEVSLNGAYWTVGGVTKAIKADSSIPDDKSQVVYSYYDTRSLYIHLSNHNKITFRSRAIEQEEEIERRQNLPIVKITTNGGAEIVDKKNYVKGTIEISDPEKLYSEETSFKATMGIRGRGNSTWSWPKKPWKVKLDQKASLLGMPADKEWCLLANYSDRTLLRNVVAMQLSEICGFSWTPRIRSVEVYLNDKYQGVYTLCEHKKVSSSRVDIDVVGEEVTEGDALTGDYYFEIEESQDADVCWWTSMHVPMMFNEPENPNQAQIDYSKKLFADFEAALSSSSFKDPEKGYAAYIDVDSFIDYYIVQELTKNVDGNLRKSSFITKKKGGKMEMYHLWDFDLTLGNCGYFDARVGNGPEGFYIKDFNSIGEKDKGWYYRLFQDPAFTRKVVARWDELMPKLKGIPLFIENEAAVLDPAQKRNFSVWPIEESVDWVRFPSLGSYEAEVEYLIKFYNTRLQWLDTALHNLPQ